MIVLYMVPWHYLKLKNHCFQLNPGHFPDLHNIYILLLEFLHEIWGPNMLQSPCDKYKWIYMYQQHICMHCIFIITFYYCMSISWSMVQKKLYRTKLLTINLFGEIIINTVWMTTFKNSLIVAYARVWCTTHNCNITITWIFQSLFFPHNQSVS